ncbi:hypothetical protein C1645_249630 [Glomus cerebriforme]|uniref:Uncharacterized protein n=1 Tax=Glomus cerebriforme TaxID=658196 RepID=A0A397TRD2_9GLOM|nr:hypothetical protein C1645_249630 [Glomus cerebriforme]
MSSQIQIRIFLLSLFCLYSHKLIIVQYISYRIPSVILHKQFFKKFFFLNNSKKKKKINDCEKCEARVNVAGRVRYSWLVNFTCKSMINVQMQVNNYKNAYYILYTYCMLIEKELDLLFGYYRTLNIYIDYLFIYFFIFRHMIFMS